MSVDQNFDALNQAVDAESQKQGILNKVARSRHLFFSTAFLFLVIGGLLLIILLLLTIYKLYFYEPSPKQVEVPYVVEKLVEKQVPVNVDEQTLRTLLTNLSITDLNITSNTTESNSDAITEGSPSEPIVKLELSEKERTLTQGISDTTLQQESNQTLDGEYIKTSFTIFHSSTTATGEVVVTGKTYSPDNIKVPTSQYCYLESSDSQVVGGKHIAVVGKNGFDYTTSDNYEKQLASVYCFFE